MSDRTLDEIQAAPLGDEPGLLDALFDLNWAAAVDPAYHPFGP